MDEMTKEALRSEALQAFGKSKRATNLKLIVLKSMSSQLDPEMRTAYEDLVESVTKDFEYYTTALGHVFAPRTPKGDDEL